TLLIFLRHYLLYYIYTLSCFYFYVSFFFFNTTATTEIYTLSLHDALPICQMLTQAQTAGQYFTNDQIKEMTRKVSAEVDLAFGRSEERFSRNAETDLVCRLLLEKKNADTAPASTVRYTTKRSYRLYNDSRF